MIKLSKSAIPALSLLLAMVLATVSATPAYAQDPLTEKPLTSSMTLAKTQAGDNSLTIQFFKPDGSNCRDNLVQVLTDASPQLIYVASNDNTLNCSDGSAVVSAGAPLGAVVQTRLKPEDRASINSSAGAYIGVDSGGTTVNVPLVLKEQNSLTGINNSQIAIQNTGADPVTASVDFIDGITGASVFNKTGINIPVGASNVINLKDEGSLPSGGWFGSAVVSATGGEVAVVSNLGQGVDTVQTYNAFSNVAQKWLVPLFTSKLGNGLSTPVAVQNLSGGTIAAGAITLNCIADAANTLGNFSVSNSAAVQNTASAIFNPATDAADEMPDGWFGSCSIDTSGNDTVAFVQMRFIGTAQAASYEAIPAGGTEKQVLIPLYAKRLGNGFATAVTVQNLNESAAANIELKYEGGTGAAANCSDTFNAQIPAGASFIQNHRLASGAGSVPSIGDGCFGTLVVTSSDQPIDAFVQLTDYLGVLSGDPFMAHNAITVE